MSNSNGVNPQNGPSGDNNNKYIYTVVGIVVLILIVWGIYAGTHSNNSATSTPTQTVSQGTPSNNATSTPTSTPVTATNPANLTYGAAIKAYPERFQFNGCEGTPATMSVRSGTPVMLDNRGTAAITIKADTQTYRLAGYGFAIFHPSVIENLTVTCNGKNSVTLNVEK